MKAVFYDTESGKWKELLSLEIQDGKFSSINCTDVDDFTNVEEYILPGFIDAHIHVLENPYRTILCEDIPKETPDSLWKRAIKNMNDALASGVTTIKDLGGRYFSSIEIKNKIVNSDLDLPNFHTSGCFFSRKGGHGEDRGAILINNETEFINHLEFLKENDIHLVKILNDKQVFSDDELASMIDVAHEYGMVVSVHAFHNETAMSAVTSGTDILEHAADFSDELLYLIEKNDVIVVPTFVSAYDSCYNSCEGIGNDVSDTLLKEWYESECRVIAKLFDKNIKVALGSDGGFLGTPCNSVIREIQLLNKHFDISVEKLMNSANIITPQTIKGKERLGLIKKGYIADYVCYNNNPLSDLKQLEKPSKVFLKGKQIHLDKIDYRQLSKKDVSLLMEYLSNPFFDCGNIADFWSVSELEAWFSNQNDVCVGAFIGEKLIGFCLTHFHVEAHKVHLENIFVVENYRKRGIAHHLFDTIKYTYLQKSDKLRFIGLVDEHNNKALKFLKEENMIIGNKMIWVQLNIN